MDDKGHDEVFSYHPEGSDAELEEIAGAEKVDRSALPPDERTPVITRAQYEAREIRDDYNRWRVRRKAYSEAQENRFSDPGEKYWKYRARPLWQTVLFGALAVVMFVGQWFLPEINEMMDRPLGVDAEGLVGIARFIMMVIGAYCAFIAWPRYRHRDSTDAEEQKQAHYKEEFRRKFRR